MNLNTLSAALCVAYNIADVDGIKDEEREIFVKEINSFKLSREQRVETINRALGMDVLDAIITLRDADSAARDEADALVIITMFADGELSEKEAGAYILMNKLCHFRLIGLEEAHKILGF
ncbi:MAG: hypothetical protein IKQ94_02100 [Bacteroidales bacterium]|nr:hypothetical protein [Bacteroidales bacterium]